MACLLMPCFSCPSWRMKLIAGASLPPMQKTRKLPPNWKYESATASALVQG